MTHAEQYSTSEPCAPALVAKRSRRRVVCAASLAVTLGITGTILSSSRPASADTIANIAGDKAKAAGIAKQIQANQGQIQTLTNQVQAADYQLNQLGAQIAANQAEVTKDQAEVTKDQDQLRTQAIADYTSSGTSNQITQMFSGNPNTSVVRSEYASIATGNVTTTIDNLHTAQSQLQATQSALKTQQSQQVNTRDNLSSQESQANTLVSQDQQALNSVNANIQTLVQQQQAAGGGGGPGGGDRRVQRQGGGRPAGPGDVGPGGVQHRSGQIRRFGRWRHRRAVGGQPPSGTRRRSRGHPGGGEPARGSLCVGR